jgi:tripartite-type tricarboxylate transporter receptor subunit TctC
VIRLALFILGVAFAACAAGQAYPSRPVKMVVPFPPGGGFDGIARPFSEKLASLLGQPIVIENRPGAAGNVGAEYAARQPADGYTLLFANDFLATNPPILKSTPYDPIRDFVPVSKVGTVPTGLAIHPSLEAKDWRELVMLGRLKPLTYGTPGIGSVPHLVGALMNLEGTIRLLHVPYKGTSPAVSDAIGGQIDIVITTLSSLTPQIRAGKLRGIAVIGPRRSPTIPELPTLAEAGGPSINAEIWYGLFVPAGTPAAIVQQLNQVSIQALASVDLADRLRKAGYDPGSSTAQALGEQLKNDLAKWTQVVNEAKIPRE